MNAVPVQWTTLDLGDGHRSQIEASAGTGKTWTISVLYLRLLLEYGHSARAIVVATFTDAAAQELAARIRHRLFWAVRAAERYAAPVHEEPRGSDDALYLLQRWQHDESARVRDLMRLRLALAELDLAPIGTLHSLCARILREHPLAAGSSLDAGELVAETRLHEELFDDVRRRLAQSAAPLDAGDRHWLHSFATTGAERFAGMLRLAANTTIALDAPAPVAFDWREGGQHLDALRALWEDVGHFTRSNSRYRARLRKLIDHIEAGDPDTDCDDLDVFIEGALDKHIRSQHLLTWRAQPCIDFAERAASYAPAAQAQAVLRYREQIARGRERLLRERGLLTYDALIERVHAALQRGPALADALHAIWPVALIDEFQDTDARQYAILDRIHRDDSGSPRGCLVMIGDPKQAIYAFRGGDIQAYRRAVQAADQRMGLHVNYRSSRAYVAALNAFYGRVAPGFTRLGETAPFDYVPVHASDRGDEQGYRIDGQASMRPLVFHYFENAPESQPGRVGAALQGCAFQIAGMLADGRHTLGARPVQPGDIAVLLPTNRHVAELRRLLARAGVPCAGAGRQTVYDSEWAGELQVILHALVHRDDAPAQRAALTTRLFGIDPAALPALAADTARWQVQVAALQRLAEAWQRQGVLAVVQQLILRGRAALAGHDDFERNVTDLRHLGELLQEADDVLHGPEQLLAWLAAQRRDPEHDGEDPDEPQLRIESDAARVRLMTLHASKGLEFPIVFLPLMWAQVARRRTPYPVVADAEYGRRVADLGTDAIDARRQQAARDDQDERLRVLYVALTRAEHACHVYALPPSRLRDASGKPPFADPERSALDMLIERLLQARERDPQSIERLPGIEWRSGWPDRPARYRPPPPTPQAPIVEPLPPPRPPRGVHSFSTLVRQAQGLVAEEAAAIDEAAIDDAVAVSPGAAIGATAEAHPDLLVLDALRGTELGNALHAIIELRDPARPVREQLPFVVDQFIARDVPTGDGDALAAAWAQRIDAALAADLGDGLCLAAIATDAQRAEMEFHFAVEGVPIDALRRVCVAHGEANLIPETLAQGRLNGLFTGKIDLVLAARGRFHVLDYKGNALGLTLADYAPASLALAMDAHHYRLQALIYLLALDRLLAQRIDGYCRDRDLGDAIYVFLRAAGLAPGAGVWRHRFDDALIEALQRALATPVVAA